MYSIYANIGGILMVYVTIYGSTMDPSWGIRLPKETWAHFCLRYPQSMFLVGE